jgi:hypothetical protein
MALEPEKPRIMVGNISEASQVLKYKKKRYFFIALANKLAFLRRCASVGYKSTRSGDLTQDLSPRKRAWHNSKHTWQLMSFKWIKVERGGQEEVLGTSENYKIS